MLNTSKLLINFLNNRGIDKFGVIAVDFQYDFTNPNGSLYVKGSEEAVKNSIPVLKNSVFSVFTGDWHPVDHCSFKKYDGEWPRHCVQYSQGASFDEKIVDYVSKENSKIFYKGTNAGLEEYGAFCAIIKDWVYNSEGDHMIHIPKDIPYIIVGVAGDYCVFETYRNLKKMGYNVIPYYPGIAFIGESFDFEKRKI